MCTSCRKKIAFIRLESNLKNTQNRIAELYETIKKISYSKFEFIKIGAFMRIYIECMFAILEQFTDSLNALKWIRCIQTAKFALIKQSKKSTTTHA